MVRLAEVLLIVLEGTVSRELVWMEDKVCTRVLIITQKIGRF
jgi:hypothetical protein